ncbi:hypothetical protein [[Micrococcus luteus] ATCC 49442]|uniref:hypothetical protein n=1 Tax=[Micrococcus luteus] ATCC 49442 TaxID=2698727 RepID=UPI001AD7A200|nr:hypothetical protein [[Micrococcus luteus] ATCC 49442]
MTEDVTGQSRRPERAVRLIFEYDGDDVILISQQDVDVATTRLGILREPPLGNYVEVRAADGGALSRVAIGEVFSTSVEVFPEHAGEAIVRLDVDKPRGAFTVVVPTAEEATQVAVLGVRAVRGAEAKAGAERPAPEELGVFPLMRKS